MGKIEKIMLEEWNNKKQFAKDEIKHKIIDVMPPEQEVAHRMWMYGITEEDLLAIRKEMELNISDPIFYKISNYLRDEWR